MGRMSPADDVTARLQLALEKIQPETEQVIVKVHLLKYWLRLHAGFIVTAVYFLCSGNWFHVLMDE